MADRARRDTNQVTGLLAESNAADGALVSLWADPTTHRLLCDVSITGGGTSSADGASYVAGTTAGTPAMGARDDTSPSLVSEDKLGIVRISTRREMYVQVRDAAGNERGLNIDSSGGLAIAANSSVNVAQINGVTVLMGNGVTGTGSQRVTIASDNTPFAVKTDQTTHGTTDLVAADITKLAGTAIDGNSGVKSAGTLRVVIATDQPQLTNKLLVTPDANSAVNVAQMNGVTITMGNGIAGTGVQRVTLASDSTGNIATIGTSVTPGTAAGNLGKAEDAAHASGDTGVAVWGVRNDNLATTYGADQDYGPLATDLKGRVMVAQKAATGTLTNVASSASNVTLLAANSARIGATITNDSSALLYIKLAATASTTSYTVVLAGAASAPFSYYEVPAGYTGIIDGIWASATGNARVTEIT